MKVVQAGGEGGPVPAAAASRRPAFSPPLGLPPLRLKHISGYSSDGSSGGGGGGGRLRPSPSARILRWRQALIASSGNRWGGRGPMCHQSGDGRALVAPPPPSSGSSSSRSGSAAALLQLLEQCAGGGARPGGAGGQAAGHHPRGGLSGSALARACQKQLPPRRPLQGGSPGRRGRRAVSCTVADNGRQEGLQQLQQQLRQGEGSSPPPPAGCLQVCMWPATAAAMSAGPLMGGWPDVMAGPGMHAAAGERVFPSQEGGAETARGWSPMQVVGSAVTARAPPTTQSGGGVMMRGAIAADGGGDIESGGRGFHVGAAGGADLLQPAAPERSPWQHWPLTQWWRRPDAGGGGSSQQPLLPTLASAALPLPSAPAMVRSRVEPKTFFAAERTFLAWVNIAVLVRAGFRGLCSRGQQGPTNLRAFDIFLPLLGQSTPTRLSPG